MAYNELYSLGGGVITDDANATASQILSGYTAYVKGKKVTGNIQSQGAQTITPGTSDKTIPSGKYLSGTQTIKGDGNLVAGNIKSGTSIFGVSGTFTSDGTADYSKICEGMKVYSKGNSVIGTLPERNIVGKNGAISISSYWPAVALHPNDTNAQFTQTLDKKVYICINVPWGYYNGGSYVGCDPRLFSATGRYEFLGVWGSNRDCLSWALGFLFNINSDYWSVKLIRPFPSGLVPTWRVIAQSSGSTTWSIRINDQEIRSFTSNGYYDFKFDHQINLNDSIGIIPTVNNGGICTLAIFQ